MPNLITKRCSQCYITKSIDDFHKDKTRSFGRRSHCKQCESLKYQEYAAKNREKIEDKRLRRIYGIGYGDYLEMVEKQGDRCGMCGTTENPYKSWYVDHNHATGKVRGLLCNNCNTALGMLNDDPELIEKAKQWVLNDGAVVNA